jgi:lipoyl(octanoyl) transferase
MLIDVLAEFGIPGQRVEGRSGVWLVDANRPAGDKIAAIGIRVSEGVTMHGFSLNCSNSFDAYRAIIACGIFDAGATSISRELGREVTPTDLVPLIEKHFLRNLSPSLASQRVVTA